ncbi:MAG: DeoR/GlpR family DNA-binding transcription regulator [Anaerolineales bacterium]
MNKKNSAIARNAEILDYLKEHGSAAIEELAREFNVSHMTIHRELNKLEAEGLVKKKHGGALLASQAELGGLATCAMCNKPAPRRTVFLLRQKDGTQTSACCPHCGLMLYAQRKDWQAFAADYLHGHIVSAAHATYLIGGEVNVCCVPSVLSFGSRADAEKFQKGFGGKLANMNEAVRALREMMK